MLSYHFISFFHEKPLAVIPIFGPKKSQFCENYTILWAKKVTRMPFFSLFFTKKSMLSCPYFVKTRPFSKKHTTFVSIFCRKNVHTLTNTVLDVICIEFFMKRLCCHAHVWPKMRQFCQTTLY